MTWAVFLRRCLMAQFINPYFYVGGWLKQLFELKGIPNEAEKVLPTTASEVVRVLFDSHANVAEIIKQASGDVEVSSVVVSGYAIMSQTFIVDGNIGFLFDLIGKGEFAELTQHGESVIVFTIPINAELTKSEATGVEGEMPLSVDTDGLLIISYQYSTEENDAGGTTYNITSDYYAEDGSAMYIGGQYGG